MRLLPFYIPLIMAGVLAASALRRQPARLLRVAAVSAAAFIVLLAALAATGSARYREAGLHHALGHVSVAALVFLTPAFIAAALCHRRSNARRAVHVMAAASLTLGWYITSVSGYLMPQRMPAVPKEVAAATILRFMLLHVIAGPALVLLLLACIAWRHWRLARGGGFAQ